ncbi:hypothetical protein GW7_09862 [Heterocephalus glaber]|uniref:Uncharacterized protein n=1 Tax=Heterocephalus glaber TaxID=10181 RepID=G5BK22_HETGA|nr:hypothetical protein GW7_09862 [Heterocephalus glaber]
MDTEGGHTYLARLLGGPKCPAHTDDKNLTPLSAHRANEHEACRPPPCDWLKPQSRPAPPATASGEGARRRRLPALNGVVAAEAPRVPCCVCKGGGVSAGEQPPRPRGVWGGRGFPGPSRWAHVRQNGGVRHGAVRSRRGRARG